MTIEEIMLLQPGPELDKAIGECEEGFSPSTNMNDAWELRDIFHEENGGNIIVQKYCDAYPEFCEYEKDGQKVQVWAKTTPEAICKAFLLWIHGYRGDCHPWVVFPEKKREWYMQLGLPIVQS